MNRFAAVVAAGEAAKRSHHQRMAELTRAHFERHPECRRVIVGMDDDGNVIRGDEEIDVEARCQPGWFTREMWTGEADRPVERDLAEPGIPVWQLREGDKPVRVAEYLAREHVPALWRAYRAGELRQYNTFQRARLEAVV